MIKKYLFALSIVTSVLLSSCLKDKFGQNLSDIPSTKLVELAPNDNPALGSADREYAISYNITLPPQTLKIAVHLNSTDNTYPATTVTLVRDTAEVTAYNNANGTNYQFLPDSAFTESNLTVTIPAGQQFGYLNLTIDPSKVDPNGQFMVAYKVASVSPSGIGISDTRSAVHYIIGVKNQYDGIYSLRIKTIGWAAYGISDNVPGTWPTDGSGNSIGLVTANGTSVTIYDYVRNDVLEPAFTAAMQPTAFGATNPIFVFDPVTNNLIDVRNLAPDDGRGRKFHLNPNVTDSRYDPATKTIYAAYIMQQNGRPDQQIYDTLTYVKSR